MKDARACIKCEGETIWKVDPLCFYDYKYSNVVLPVPVASRMIDTPDPGLLSRPTVRKDVGTFVVYVCASCGYSEMYATDIEEMAKLMSGEAGSRVSRASGDSDD